MQNKTFFPAFVAAFLICLSYSAFSQGPEIRFEPDGRAIIVHPDGRTEPFSGEAGQQSSIDKYPVLDVEIAPLAGDIKITSEDLRRVADRKAQLAKEAAKIAHQRAEEARQQRLALEKEYKMAAKGETNEAFLKRIRQRLDAARRTESETHQEAVIANNEAVRAEQITERGTYVQDYLQQQALKKQQVQAFEEQNFTATASYGQLLVDGDIAPFSHSPEVIQSPPENCEVVFEGVNSKGKFQKDLKKGLLFTHTDDRLRPYLKDQEYLSCQASLMQLGGYRLLSLEFTFAFPNASEAYGFIEKGSYLMIKMLNNHFVTLYSGELDRGTYDTQTKLLTYQVHYPVNQSEFNILKKNEVDTVIVSWSSGYEEYEVYAPGFFIQQAACLEE
jgi:hypothetical protein